MVLLRLAVLVAVCTLRPGASESLSPSWYIPPPSYEGPGSFGHGAGAKKHKGGKTAAGSTAGGEPAGGAHDAPHHHEEHKPLFPLDWTDYLGFVCASFGLMLAAGGGIGGGGMLVPLYILIMGFSPKHAIPLSNITVFGGACSNFYLNREKRHPNADRPLADWDLILIMQPMTIAGALLGSFANKILSELILTICLVVLLAYTTYSTLGKGFKTFARETEAAKEKKAAAASSAAAASAEPAASTATAGGKDGEDVEVEKALLADEGAGEDTASIEAGAKGVDTVARRELDKIIDDERAVPAWKWQTIWAVFAVVIAVNLVKGGGNLASPIGISCGSPGYWLSTASMFGWIAVVSYFIRSRLIASTAAKQRLGYQYVEGDIAWDGRATVIYPLICIGAGLCAGMFGIGGGIVQVPLMLQMGVNPKVASASSATMILYTSFTALTSFYVYGLLVVDYALVGLVIGMIVTYAGQIGLSILISKLGRDSLIIFSVAAVVGLSALLMGTHSVISMAEGDVSLELGKVCAEGE